MASDLFDADTSLDESDAWWNRNRPAPGKKSRNDHVADLWAGQGWDDDEALFDDGEEPTIGQGFKKEYGYRNGYGRGRRRSWYEGDEVNALGEGTANRAITAQRMVQSFIDAFTTSDHGYRVVFEEGSMAPGATSFELKTVIMDASPIFDRTLSARQCGLVLTAVTTHEVSHVEFDQPTVEAVKKAFTGKDKELALRLCNILSDNRIEKRFAAKYPGFSDVFEPALEYLSRKHHGTKVTFNPSDPGNIAVAAVRYAKWLDWSNPGMAAERDWWQALSAKYSDTDETRRHVKYIREGLSHLKAMYEDALLPPPVQPPVPPTGGGCGLPGTESDDPSDDTDEQGDCKPGGSKDTDKDADTKDGDNGLKKHAFVG